MSSAASESNNADERSEARREYYSALDSKQAQVLTLERQSKTHRLVKTMRNEMAEIWDDVEHLCIEAESAEHRSKDLQSALTDCAKINRQTLLVANDVCDELEALRAAVNQLSDEHQRASRGEFPAQSTTNCLAEPFVALWRSMTRRSRQRTQYSRFERGELHQNQEMIDDNDFCVTTQFAKTE